MPGPSCPGWRVGHAPAPEPKQQALCADIQGGWIIGCMHSRTYKLHVDYRQYALRDGSILPPIPDAHNKIIRGNTLVTGGDGYVFFLAGTYIGNICVMISLCENEPLLSLDDWEAIVEVSYHSPEGKTYLCDGEFSPRQDVGNIAHAGPGWYRIRIQTRGRAEGRRLDVPKEPVEEHVISVWPSRHQESDQVYKMDDVFRPHK